MIELYDGQITDLLRNNPLQYDPEVMAMGYAIREEKRRIMVETAQTLTMAMLDNAPEVNLYMEYSNKTCLDNVLRLFRDLNLKVLNMEITRSTETETHNACALFTLRLNKRCRGEQLIPKMNATEGVVSVEEL